MSLPPPTAFNTGRVVLERHSASDWCFELRVWSARRVREPEWSRVPNSLILLRPDFFPFRPKRADEVGICIDVFFRPKDSYSWHHLAKVKARECWLGAGVKNTCEDDNRVRRFTASPSALEWLNCFESVTEMMIRSADFSLLLASSFLVLTSPGLRKRERCMNNEMIN